MSQIRKKFLSISPLAALFVGFMVAVGLFGLLYTGNHFPVQATGEQKVVFDPMAISRIAEKAADAVVAIETTIKSDDSTKDPFFEEYRRFRRFFNLPELPQEREAQKGYGSGFIVDAKGYIVTNYHVVRNAQKVQVRLLGDEQRYSAEVLDVNPDVDIAVLKINVNKKLTALPMGSSQKARVGEWVIAIGNPFGMEHTVTVGVLSAKERQVATQVGRRNQVYNNLLQTDAAINPGNSGGPLINLKGEVIGVNSMINAAGQNLGFAQPIDNIKDVVYDVIKFGKSQQPWLGISFDSLTNLSDDTKAYFGLEKLSTGLLIQGVFPDSPAEKAGLERFDVLLEIDKKPLKEGKDLIDFIKKQKPGNVVTLLINRKGQIKVFKVTLAEKPKTEWD